MEWKCKKIIWKSHLASKDCSCTVLSISSSPLAFVQSKKGEVLMVDVYQIIDNSAPCRRIICCRPPVSDNLPPIWRQRSQRLSSLHSAALCTADQQQIDVHCTEHFVALCTTHQKTEECTARRKMHSAPTPFHFTNWKKINQNVFCEGLFDGHKTPECYLLVNANFPMVF